MPGVIRVGTSGWNYKHWRGIFYPQSLPVSRWFEHYAKTFDTVEINNSFYKLGEPATFDAWRKQAPKGFIYAVKCNRFLTHNLKLTRPEEPLERFYSRAGRLREHLGPLLYQLPPRWKKNIERLRSFCGMLPRKFQHVIELREPSWVDDDVFAVLSERGIGLCIHDLLPDHPKLVTSNVAYLRFHGAAGKYRGRYGKAALRRWAKWLSDQAASGRDAYAYFNNDIEGHAIYDAMDLLELLK
jgi:uncharacterized protein YecE (DUF72 family)